MDDFDDHVLQLLWRYNREAVALRIQYLMTAKMGQESHTVLVRMVSDLGSPPMLRLQTSTIRLWQRQAVCKLPLNGQ